jgi:drug/metabolite transporter (DMT)-like permease
MSKVNFKILGLFLFIVLAWSLAWPINKIGLDYMSPLWYTATRLIVGTLTMFVLVTLLGRFRIPTFKDYPLILIIGLLQISIYLLLANYGLAYLPPGRSSLLAYTTPLWVMPAATLFFNEEATWLRWSGFGLGLMGLLVLLNPWEMQWTNWKVVYGSAMLLLASLCWAISILCARYMHWNKSPLELIPWQLLIGTLPVVIYAVIKEPVISIHFSEPLIWSLIYTGILVTGISYWSGLVINKELPATVVSIGFLLVPVLSLLFSSFYLHEIITPSTATAMTMIFAGLVCVAV